MQPTELHSSCPALPATPLPTLQLPHPHYLIGTRDSFTHHLVPLRHAAAAANSCALAHRLPAPLTSPTAAPPPASAAWQPLPPCPGRLPRSTSVEVAGRRYTRTRYFVRAEECPDNYHAVLAACREQQGACDVSAGGSANASASTANGHSSGPTAQPAGDGEGGAAGDAAPAGLLPIGVTTYSGLFSNAELAAIEAAAGAPGQPVHACAAGCRQRCAVR